MNLEIIKSDDRYMDDCVSALKDSLLGENYFSSAGSAENAVKEGLTSDTMYVALSDSEFMGFVYYLPKGAFHSFPYIHLIVVKKSARGSGVGTKLLEYIEKVTDRDRIFLAVADFNPDAKKFYERNGYAQVGAIESLYRNGITENLMMKVL